MIQRIEVHNRVSDFSSYRAARVKSLFNAENGCNFDLIIDGVDLSGGWNIGVVVGPSGSGKTSIGKRLFDGGKIINLSDGWNTDRPIIDDIAPARDFNIVTGMLAEVNRLLSQGWTLTKRTTMSMPVVLTDAFSSCTEQALYAELERIQPEYPEEVTL